MSVSVIRKRQMALLRRLTSRSGGRHDVKLPLSQVAPTLSIVRFAGGAKFVDKDNPKYEGGSDPSYDFNTLHEKELISIAYMTVKQDAASPRYAVRKKFLRFFGQFLT
jgi:hypothetical protein